MATRAAGLGTAWAKQYNPDPVKDHDLSKVHVILFWMDSCGHCHYILEEVLPSLQETYGESLEFLLIELQSMEDIDRLYLTAEELGFSRADVVVPFLIIGDHVLVGSIQIPAELPGLIDEFIAGGGVSFPNLRSLLDILPTPIPREDPTPVPESPSDRMSSVPINTSTPVPVVQIEGEVPPSYPMDTQGFSDGFGLAIGVIIVMLASLVYSLFVLLRGKKMQKIRPKKRWTEFTIPVLTLIGLAIAGYLAYVETQSVQAFCGPVGDCNSVQSSSYAKLFGVLPIAFIGILGYGSILALWLFGNWTTSRSRELTSAIILGLALMGTLFSLYLTTLEPFVIRAVCIWCLSSAVIISLLLLFSVQAALEKVVRM